MAAKHLRQLLCEDQEPFVLKNYINERRCQLKRPVPETHLQVKRTKPISENSIFPRIFCKNACFFSFHHDSPGVKRSPLFDFSSPARSPCRNSNALIFHIPSRTAALLLEAALRIQKQSISQKPKIKTSKNFGFGSLGSILKRITRHKWKRKREIKGDEIKVYVKDILRWESSDGRNKFAERTKNLETTLGLEEKRISDVGFSCSCNSRISSAWSESYEEKSLNSETSTSRSEDSEEAEFVIEERKNGDFNSCCSSTFLFVSQTCRRPPGFQSPVTSPSRHKKQELKKEEGHVNCVAEEQFTSLSILDPQFQEAQEDEQDEGDEFDLHDSFAIVQKAKQQLLHKLRRFERLTELDPIELEKRIDEQDEDHEEEEDVDDLELSDNEQSDVFIRKALSSSDLYDVQRIPSHMKRLILDLMVEEEAELNDREMATSKLCKRLESWKEVELNSIDMMVELDFRRECDEWWNNREHVEEAAIEIELSIFSFLLEELSTELANSTGI